MTKEEIDEQIKLLKKEIMIFQEVSKRLKISEEEIEKQVNKYLEDISDLIKLRKKAN